MVHNRWTVRTSGPGYSWCSLVVAVTFCLLVWYGCFGPDSETGAGGRLSDTPDGLLATHIPRPLPTPATLTRPPATSSAPTTTTTTPSYKNASTYYATHVVTPSSNNIFFVETSCAFRKNLPPPGGVKLSPRQACAAYSAARSNRNHSVYLFHTCPLKPNYFQWSSAEVREVLKLPNFWVIEGGNEAELWFAGTPLRGFELALSKTSYPMEHTSDALRMVLLWKYGGTYLDMDVIVLKDLSDLKENWAGAQDVEVVASGIVNFELGSPVLESVLGTMARKFNPHGWVSLGPSLLTDVLHDDCNMSRVASGVGRLDKCNFTVLATKEFYPVHYSSWQVYFTPGSQIDLTSSHAVHVWNKLSAGSLTPPDSPYARLAHDYCQPVYQTARDRF